MSETKWPWLTVGYGVSVILLTLLAHWASESGQRAALLAGTAGGGVCVVLGMAGLRGWTYRPWTILVLIMVSYVLLAQTVVGWLGEGRESDSITGPALLTFALAISVGFVAGIAHAGQRRDALRADSSRG